MYYGILAPRFIALCKREFEVGLPDATGLAEDPVLLCAVDHLPSGKESPDHKVGTDYSLAQQTMGN